MLHREGEQPHECAVGIVASEFGLSPHEAHQELGGRPLRPKERRHLTTSVLDATIAMRLHRAFMATEGDKERAQAVVGNWSAEEHEYYKALQQIWQQQQS